ncbi:propanediol utilization protein [Chryseobacterium sp. FH2]|uniref:reprolysin-like metallopeptidase n=1 Tax=Chryseobacterium sp. FH2 TaxID=1674291 RepID=UPI00065AD4D3|nr:zinc-dependent metalloprotease family protein [Chryseobacterium sp. FH2]KMQ67114.1 propanediol utilization protein [Chryseobacterium sp. FH2]
MKKLITALFCSLIGGTAFAQWSPTTFSRQKEKPSLSRHYYKLDLNKIKEQLKNAQETGPNAKPVEISLPTLNGKIEKFAVYSFPVVVKDLAQQYQLGSYVGVGLDDPGKYLRFSVAPNDFQSMIIKNGEYEFIEPQNADKTVYGVHPKTKKTEGKSFVCSTSENPAAINDINELYNQGSSFTNQAANFAKTSDKKYRTMRLVVSVTGEYTQKFGGTVAGALAQINATLTRVNGVFEKDFALHLNLQNYPNVIYTDGTSDPYSAPSVGTDPNNASNANGWNVQLQRALSLNVGNDNYDIGHLFGDSGGGGNAGCIGCVCVNPTGTPATSLSKQKGSGYTSPADGIPQGDNFDIDYVAHEMGHQLGANHTFSHALETGTGVNVEPGSGTTIMGYAGITGANTDVQPHSDAYFHLASIKQVQTNLISKTCDVETVITNNPPVIEALPTYNIPKGTAFVLTASATDAENDPLTYTWEQMDNASVTINKNNLGTTTSGATFRSMVPSTSPTRYFPKLSSVLDGVLNNSNNEWESVSMVPRTTHFSVTVRDNNPAPDQKQTQYADQTIVVGNDGPFKVNTQYANVNTPAAIEWDVANTTAAPYNVANVKIDYTTDNGTSWTVLAASTPNDGSESFTFPSSMNGQVIKLRVSSINNIFYAIGKINVVAFAPCDGTAPTGVVTSNITFNSATVSWTPVVNATYVIRYRKVGETNWQQTSSTSPTVSLSGLNDATTYEVQVAAVCSGTPGAYSASTNFLTTSVTYCTASSATAAILYISNVQVSNVTNASGSNTYTNFTTNPALQVNLVKGNSYSLTVTGSVSAANFGMVFIDYNRDGVFDTTERVLNFPVANASSFTGSFTVPNTSTVVEGQPLRMRVIVGYAGASNIGLSAPAAWVCGTGNFNDGEVEDYNVVVTATALATNEVKAKDNFGIYPNPVTDILNVTKVSNKATFEIHNVVGQIVKKGTIDNNKVNVTELLKGNYIISIKDNNISESFKFIKK